MAARVLLDYEPHKGHDSCAVHCQENSYSAALRISRNQNRNRAVHLQVLLSCPSDKATYRYDKDILKRNKDVSRHPYCIGRQDKEKYECFNEKRGRFCVVVRQKVGIFPKLKG